MIFGLLNLISTLPHYGSPSFMSGIFFLFVVAVQGKVSSWSTSAGPFLAHAYQFFRPVGATISWHRVVWEQWSLPKYSFILWLAALGKLRTRDRLRFIPIDPTCVFCRQEEESHSHLFFICGWRCQLWSRITAWLRINRVMNSLSSALCWLHPKTRNIAARMRRVLLGIVVYLIWEEHNRRIFYGKSRDVTTVFRRFQVLFYIIFHFHERDHSLLHVDWWSMDGIPLLAVWVLFLWVGVSGSFSFPCCFF